MLLVSVTGYAISNGASAAKFSEKKDVLSNRGSLGQRQRVFIHYVPTTSGEYMVELEKRIYDFSSHLITYGFDVRVDLLCDQSTRFDRAAWSDRELSQAHWVIFVCSRSSYELFNLSYSSEYSPTCYIDQETKNNISLLRRTLYNHLSNDATNKVIPVILLQGDSDIAYVPPMLRDSNNILCIFEDTPFDYDNQGGHLERLICRMAGINRVEINASGSRKVLVELPSKISISK